ncbi:MAG: DUF192 domain-containing protein [Pseudomonadota bacterium]
MRHLLSLLVMTVAAAGASFAQTLETVTVRSMDADHTFRVEIADDPEETSRGLMNRETLAADAGMLFDFGAPREANMWMKNTLISLDMLFLAPDGEVLAIAERARPGSLRRINPGVPVKGVLEINGGLSAELNLKPGDVVEHRIFGNVEVAD